MRRPGKPDPRTGRDSWLALTYREWTSHENVAVQPFVTPAEEAVTKSKNDVIPGRGRQPASPETRNTDVRKHRVRPVAMRGRPGMTAYRLDFSAAGPFWAQLGDQPAAPFRRSPR